MHKIFLTVVLRPRENCFNSLVCPNMVSLIKLTLFSNIFFLKKKLLSNDYNFKTIRICFIITSSFRSEKKNKRKKQKKHGIDKFLIFVEHRYVSKDSITKPKIYLYNIIPVRRIVMNSSVHYLSFYLNLLFKEFSATTIYKI